MRTTHRFYFFAVLILLAGSMASGCTDYPPIDSSFSFNITHSAQFLLSNSATANQDTSLVASVTIDTNAYADSLSAAYLLKAAQVGRISLTSNNPAFNLNELGPVTILIGADTVATDTLPEGALDTNFVLTNADITKYLRDTSFTTTLECSLQHATESPVTLTCTMTILFVANTRP